MSDIHLIEKYATILSGLESRFIYFSKEDPKLHDHDVLKVLDELIRCYRAKSTNYPYEEETENLKMNLYKEVKSFMNQIESGYKADDIQDALKRLKKSLQLWNKELGSRGYLSYISQFLVLNEKK